VNHIGCRSKEIFMNKLVTLLAAAALSGLTTQAMADQDTPTTREQVLAELEAARASGELHAMVGEDSGSFWLARQPNRSTLTRAQVKAELVAAGGPQAVAINTSESGNSATFAAAVGAGPLTRAQVHAEVLRARSRGELYAMVGEDSGSSLPAGFATQRDVIYAGPNLGERQPAN